MIYPFKIRLTAAQQSALECSGVNEEEQPGSLFHAWGGGPGITIYEHTNRDRLCSEIIEYANAEFEQAEHSHGEERRACMRAGNALAKLTLKVRAATREMAKP